MSSWRPTPLRSTDPDGDRLAVAGTVQSYDDTMLLGGLRLANHGRCDSIVGLPIQGLHPAAIS